MISTTFMKESYRRAHPRAGVSDEAETFADGESV
jgi:hypothetical protein